MKFATLVLFLSWVLMTSSAAQEAGDEQEGDSATEGAATEAEDVQEEDDEFLDLNTDHTDDDDDVFVPTDEVSYQQSVPFPTDI